MPGGVVLQADADGHVETEDQAHISALESIGFKAVFSRKTEKPAADAPAEVPADETTDEAPEGEAEVTEGAAPTKHKRGRRG